MQNRCFRRCHQTQQDLQIGGFLRWNGATIRSNAAQPTRIPGNYFRKSITYICIRIKITIAWQLNDTLKSIALQLVCGVNRYHEISSFALHVCKWLTMNSLSIEISNFVMFNKMFICCIDSGKQRMQMHSANSYWLSWSMGRRPPFKRQHSQGSANEHLKC